MFGGMMKPWSSSERFVAKLEANLRKIAFLGSFFLFKSDGIGVHIVIEDSRAAAVCLGSVWCVWVLNNLGKVMQKGICLVGMMGSTSMVLQVPAAVDEGDGRVAVVGPFQSKGFMERLEQWELIVMPGRHLVVISTYFLTNNIE